MATISATTNEKVFQIKQWLGLNECEDGDTKLKMGEASIMRNFRVTRDGNLRKRPGARCVWRAESPLSSKIIRGAWYGELGGTPMLIVCFADEVYSMLNAQTGEWEATKLGDIAHPSSALSRDRIMFEFGGKVIIIGYNAIYSWDGTTFAQENVYVPLIAINCTNLSYDTNEQINKITQQRRVYLSPDGSNKLFTMPESFTSVVSVKQRSTGSDINFSLVAGGGTYRQIKIDPAPAAGDNTIEVIYKATETTLFPADFRSMLYYEYYNGDQYNRIFLYGNGTNQAYYTGVNGLGQPDPTYYPDLNVVSLGSSGEQITNMIRYNSRLFATTHNETYSIQYGQYTLVNGDVIAAFYTTPVHRSIGGDVPGGAQLVLNSPVLLHKKNVYSWSGNNYGNLSLDERQAKRIGDRVFPTLKKMTGTITCYDDNFHQEYYICERTTGMTLVWNYVQDCWYTYTGIRMFYCFLHDGKLHYLQRGYGAYPVSLIELDNECPYDTAKNDTPAAIDCRWESGNMAFNIDYQRKYSAMLWVGVKPEPKAEVTVSVKTDRTDVQTEKVVTHNYSSFVNLDFSDFTFNQSTRPKLKRLKIKAKKFVYYKLCFSSNNNDSTATVTTADIRVRFTGYAK